MKVGIILTAQNSDEFVAPGQGHVPHHGSSLFFRDEIRAGELAVSLGFNSVWCVEHHFTAHGESPAPLQQLAYFAGRVDADLGTGVVVLPWNDPVRVAEQISVLDNLMPEGRTFTIGLGRGSAQQEFDAFGVPLGESNERFVENWEIIRLLLTEENVTYKGKWRSLENLTLLPRPRSSDLVERAVYSWGSKSSLKFAAASGFLPMFVPRGSVEEQRAEMIEYNAIRESNGLPQVRPAIFLNVFADENRGYAREMGRKYLKQFYLTTLEHYERFDARHFRDAGNYAETAAAAEKNAKRDRDELLGELADFQPHGTPDEVLKKLRHWYDQARPSTMCFSVRYGGMSWDETERNIRTIATLLPEIESWGNPA